MVERVVVSALAILSHVLHLQPIGLAEWFHLLAWAGTLVIVMEIHKLTWRRRN